MESYFRCYLKWFDGSCVFRRVLPIVRTRLFICWADNNRRSLRTLAPDCGVNGTYSMATERFPDYCFAEYCNLYCHNMLSVASRLSIVCVLLKTCAVSLRDNVCLQMGWLRLGWVMKNGLTTLSWVYQSHYSTSVFMPGIFMGNSSKRIPPKISRTAYRDVHYTVKCLFAVSKFPQRPDEWDAHWFVCLRLNLPFSLTKCSIAAA